MSEPQRGTGPIPASDELGSRLGLVVDEFGPDRVVMTLPVDGNRQPYGILHGGATCALIEAVASLGAVLAAGVTDHIAMGLQQTTNFIRPAREGFVRGVGTPVHNGRTTAVWNVEVTQVETGKLVAVGRVTLAVRDALEK